MSRWLMGILALLCAGALYLGYRVADLSGDLKAQAEELAEMTSQRDGLVDAMVALGESNARISERRDRTDEILQGIRNAPVTTGCGPSVHGAVDSLRNQNN